MMLVSGQVQLLWLVVAHFSPTNVDAYRFSAQQLQEDFNFGSADAKINQQQQQQPEVRLGAVLGTSTLDVHTANMLRTAVDHINHKQPALRFHLVLRVRFLTQVDSFHVATAACQLLDEGVVLLMASPGRAHAAAIDYMKSLSSTLQVPYVHWNSFHHASATYGYEGLSSSRKEPPRKLDFSFNLYPSDYDLARASVDLIDYFDWRQVLVVYHDETSLFRLESLLRARRAPPDQPLFLRVKRYQNDTVYSLLKMMAKQGWRQVLVDLDRACTAHFLRAALNCGLMNRNYHYILSNIDGMTLDLENYRHNFANITLMELEPADEALRSLLIRQLLQQQKLDLSEDQRLQKPLLRSKGVLTSNARLTSTVAMAYDAVSLIAQALQRLSDSRSDLFTSRHSSCREASKSGGAGGENDAVEAANTIGVSLLNSLQSCSLPSALTGALTFRNGERETVRLRIFHVKAEGPVQFGIWTSSNGLNASSLQEVYNLDEVRPLNREKFNVVSVAQEPFVWIKREFRKEFLTKEGKLRPGKRFSRTHVEGYCIDLMEMIANKSGFEWEIYRSPNDTYGSKDDVTGEWSGMVGELLNGNAQLALGSFTISYVREKVIDFTKPYMNLGISILFKKPKGEKPGLFSFLNPLAVEIWLYVVAAYLVVTFLIYVLARFSPYEWVNPHCCDGDSNYLENDFTLSNSFWFTVGTLMQQGSDINPRAVSTRIVGGIWWFFTLIIISSYTANLAAFLTVERMVNPIENVDDLAQQTTIKYGALAGGSTLNFFRSSHITNYQNMWQFMKKHEKEVITPSTDVGIDKVRNSNYAFLMESAMIEFHVERDSPNKCELTQIGGLIDSKGYGIGVQPNREALRDELTLHILELQRDQHLQTLKNRWWRETGTCRGKTKKENMARALNMRNVGGIFMVLLCGIVVAILVALVEFVWNARKSVPPYSAAEQQQQNGGAPGLAPRKASICAQMGTELRFALNCYGSNKKPKTKCAVGRRSIAAAQLADAHWPKTYLPIPPPPPPPQAPCSSSHECLEDDSPLHSCRQSCNYYVSPHQPSTPAALNRRSNNCGIRQVERHHLHETLT